MSLVNPPFPQREWHVPVLMGQLFRRVSEVFDGEDWHGLRQSHLRVLSGVPPQGISITDLAQRVAMTKQGCGQLVSGLVECGDLRIEASPSDGRVRLVRRTRQGARTYAAVVRRIHAVEREWAEEVGEQRYRVFREVLEEVALREMPPVGQISER